MMFEDEIADGIQNLVMKYTSVIHSGLSVHLDLPFNYDEKHFNLILKGFVANAALGLYFKHKLRHFNYRNVLSRAHKSYVYANGNFVLKEANQEEIHQVENDNKDYSPYLYSYNYTSDRRHNMEPAFDKIANVLLEKMGLDLAQKSCLKTVSYLLEKEYLKMELDVKQKDVQPLAIIRKKIFKKVWHGQ